MPSNVNTAVVTMDDLRKMRGDIEKTGKGGTREAAIVTQADIKRMREGAVIVSEKDQQQKKITEEQKAQQQAAAKARKAKMVQMDRDRSKKLPPTEIEVEQNQRADGLLAKAQQ